MTKKLRAHADDRAMEDGAAGHHRRLTDLIAIKRALDGLTDFEIHAIKLGTSGMRQEGLRMWIEDACDWELHRRAGRNYELLPPEAPIDPLDDAISIDAAIAMRATFAQDSPAVRAFFNALVDLLTGKGPSTSTAHRTPETKTPPRGRGRVRIARAISCRWQGIGGRTLFLAS